MDESHKTSDCNDIRDAASAGSSSHTDPDLARLVTAWLTLPEPTRAAMLALLNTSGLVRKVID